MDPCDSCTPSELATALRELATIWDPAIHHSELLENAAAVLGRLARLGEAEAMAVPPDYYANDRLWPELVARMEYARTGQLPQAVPVAADGGQDAH
jgi:hypothetical protein